MHVRKISDLQCNATSLPLSLPFPDHGNSYAIFLGPTVKQIMEGSIKGEGHSEFLPFVE